MWAAHAKRKSRLRNIKHAGMLWVNITSGIIPILAREKPE
jgi:hypothetical protein